MLSTISQNFVSIRRKNTYRILFEISVESKQKFDTEELEEKQNVDDEGHWSRIYRYSILKKKHRCDVYKIKN